MNLSGKIIDSEGETLPSAHVMVSDSSGSPTSLMKGVVSGLDGDYSIEVSPADYLTASFVGVGKKTVRASEVCKQNSCNFDFKLSEGGNILKEVLVFADKKGKTNWKKIALISGISIIGLVVIYFGVKKLKK